MAFRLENRIAGHTVKHRYGDQQRGAVMVEAAIVFPVLFLIIAGIIQFAMIYSAQVNVRNAAAVGARAGILEGASNDDIIAYAQAALVSPLDGAQLVVTPNDITVAGEPYLEVAASYPLPVWFTSVVPGLGANINISATTRMR